MDKKKTEPAMDRTLTHTFQNRSIRLPDGFPHSHTASPTTDVFGFLPENIARYKEIVKQNFTIIADDKKQTETATEKDPAPDRRLSLNGNKPLDKPVA